LSQRRVAQLIPIERMTLRYQHHRDPQEALRMRLCELAGSRVRYGYRRLTVPLRRARDTFRHTFGTLLKANG
jgi:putative transposase